MTKSSNINKGNILDECTKGNFQKILDYVKSNLDGKITNRIAIKILISCCNACVYKKDDISEDLLFDVINCILPFLRDLNEADFLSYIQSLYHVIKFLIYKGSLHIIVQMEDMLISAFQPSLLTKKQQDVYLSIAKMLHNIIAKSALNGSGNCEDLYVQISIMVLNVCARFLDLTTSLNLASSCFKSLIYMRVGVPYQIEYYKKLLLSFNFSQVEPKCEDVFKHINYLSCNILNNILSTYDFEKGEEFLNIVASYVSKVLKIEEYIHIHQVLRYFLIIKIYDKFPEIDKCTDSLKILHDIWGKNDCRKEITQYLGKLLKTLQDYLSSNPKEWSNLSEDLQLQMVEFIQGVYLVHVSEGSIGDMTESMYSGLFYSKVIFSLIKLSITHSRHSSSEYHVKCTEILGIHLKNVDFLKTNNFEQWGNAWSILAIELYNIAVNSYQHGNNDIAQKYFHLLLQYFITLENAQDTLIIKYTALLNTCQALIEINSKDHKQALAFIALAVFFCKKDRGPFMTKWITIRHNLKNDEHIQQLNLVSALEGMKTNFPELQLSKSEKTSLLHFELDYYKRKWKSRLPILSVLKELYTVSSTENMAKTVVKMFIDMDLPHQDELHDILVDTLNNYEVLAKRDVNLAVLHYLLYKSCHKKLVSKNAEEMEKVVTPLKVDSDPSDASEDPDVVSSFESLKLDVHMKNLNNLEFSLETFDLLVPKLQMNSFEHVTLSQLYNLLMTISSEFKLLRFKLKAIHSLELALKVAQVLNDVPAIIKSISLIIEQVDSNDKSFHTLVNLADSLINNESIDCQNSELCIMYYICKSKALLYNNYNQSYNVFLKAKELMKLAEERDDLGILKSWLFLLNSKFSMLPCNFGTENHRKSLISDAYSATEIMFGEYRNTKFDEPYKISLLLQASEELIKLYHYLKCPREVRTYAKEILLLTQKLVLPLHSAAYLMYLAHADLLSNNQDDCQVKVADMATILSINAMNGESCGRDYLKQCSPSSPGLRTQSFAMPSSIQHNNSCKCYYCNCSEYQKLVLENVRLSALINVKENNFRIAEDFFQGALKLYESYSQKSTNQDLVPEFLTSYGFNLLNYSSHLWRTKRKDEAKKMIDELWELMKPRKLMNVHLWNDLVIQKLGYLTEDEIPDPTPELQKKMHTLSVSDNSDIPKTPETKQSKVSVVVERSQGLSPRKLRVKKCLPLSFSPTEADTAKGPLTFNEKTQTPKIEIYTEKRTRRKINPNLEKTEIPIIKISAAASEKKTNPKMNASQEPSSSSSVSLHANLKSRTKLLTEKLKKEIQSSEHRDQNNRQDTAKRQPPRKNLMMELASSDTDQKSKGAVRKSSRTKK